MTFKPGQSGNPTGGTLYKGEWAASIRKVMHEVDKSTRLTKMHRLAQRLVKAGMDGDVSAIREIGDRIDGKPKQEHEHGGELSAIVYHVVTGVPRADDPQD